MNRRRLLIGAALLLVLVVIVCFAPRTAGAKPTQYRAPDGSAVTLDIAQEDDRDTFLEIFAEDEKAQACGLRADYAMELVYRRDRGESEEMHLAEVKDNYERTRDEPEGAVAYHVYVDFQRMVRDIHRLASTRDSSSLQLFKWDDGNVFWEREWKWCYTYR